MYNVHVHCIYTLVDCRLNLCIIEPCKMLAACVIGRIQFLTCYMYSTCTCIFPRTLAWALRAAWRVFVYVLSVTPCLVSCAHNTCTCIPYKYYTVHVLVILLCRLQYPVPGITFSEEPLIGETAVRRKCFTRDPFAVSRLLV